MVAFPTWLILLVLGTVGLGFALIKAPKAMLALLLVALLAVPVLFYARLGPRTPATAVVIAPVTPGPGAATARIESTNGPRIRAPIIVELDAPTTNPSTQPSGKAWVDDWEGFVNSSELPRRWLLAGTTVPFATENEARLEARKQAAIILLDYVRSEFDSRPRATVGDRLVGSTRWLMSQLQTALMNNELIADEHITRENRSYGQVWSCQLLLDASPRTLARMVDGFQGAAQRQVERSAVTWGGLAALVVVIVLLYAFLNWVTRGYFVWRLRAAAMMIVIAALLAVMAAA
jgi:hypothetical protein